MSITYCLHNRVPDKSQDSCDIHADTGPTNLRNDTLEQDLVATVQQAAVAVAQEAKAVAEGIVIDGAPVAADKG